MHNIQLFRKRHLWLPTIWGALAVFLFACIVVLLLARYLHAYLSPVKPYPAADVLVIEGWISEPELAQAVALIRDGNYKHIVTSGGPIDFWPKLIGKNNFADLAADYLEKQGVRDVEAAPAPHSAQDRTYLSAVKVREWAYKRGIKVASLNVVSSGPHARRTRHLYQLAFGDSVRVGIIASRSREYDGAHWWETSAGTKSVMGETISYAWTLCCFHPGEPGSHEELWGIPASAAAR